MDAKQQEKPTPLFYLEIFLATCVVMSPIAFLGDDFVEQYPVLFIVYVVAMCMLLTSHFRKRLANLSDPPKPGTSTEEP
ncbi:MAG: hypothetical protein AAGI44_13680 [Pseudomonadota bacterium]